jgi:ketosteroid isomerase-like protein
MQIIVWKDKHSNKYYDASTLEAWDASAIEILRELTDDDYGYWREYDPWVSDEDKRLAAIDLTNADPSVLAELEKKVTRAKRTIERGIEEASDNKKRIELAKRYVEAGTSPTMVRGKDTKWEQKMPASWVLISNNAGGEYETIRLEDVFTVNEK